MGKIKFESESIKENYQDLLKRFKVLPGIIKYISNDGKDILIKGISEYDYEIYLYFKKDKEVNLIFLDLLKGKVYLKNRDNNRSLIFKNIRSKNPVPIGYHKSFINITIDESFLFKFNGMENIRFFEIEVDDTEKYALIIKSDEEFNELNLEKALFDDRIIKNIEDLYKVIINSLDIENLTIYIGDIYNSSIVIDNGKTITYDVYKNDKDYMKKLGEYHGKKER